MPGNFPGYSSLALKGLAIRGVRPLVFYNPWITGYTTYPGTGRLSTGAHTTSDLFVDQDFPAAAIGTVLTRQRDGAQHTITAVSTAGLPAGSQTKITVTPAWTSPVNSEQYAYQIKSVATTATTTSTGMST